MLKTKQIFLFFTFLLAWPKLSVAATASKDTLTYVQIVNENRYGFWKTWKEGDTIIYESQSKFLFPRKEKLVIDDKGLPSYMELEGKVREGFYWKETYHYQDGKAKWLTALELEEKPLAENAFYQAIYPAHDLGVLARALLKQKTAQLKLIPNGNASIEKVQQLEISNEKKRIKANLYAIYGIDLSPRYIWLDNNGNTIANEWSVLSIWQDSYGALMEAKNKAIANHRITLKEQINPKSFKKVLIRNARLLDIKAKTIKENYSILIEENKIAGIGMNTEFQYIKDAHIIDARGKLAMPGLWDMHTHIASDYNYNSMYMDGNALPLNLVSGVTFIRDMGSNYNSMATIMQQSNAGLIASPRIYPAGRIDKGDFYGSDFLGIYVDDQEQAREAVKTYASNGYKQLKFYSKMTPDLLTAAIQEGKKHHMRISGHVPETMSLIDTFEYGFQEVQHIWWFLFTLYFPDPNDYFTNFTDELWMLPLTKITPDSRQLQDVLPELKKHKITVDPTLSIFADNSGLPNFLLPDIERYPTVVKRRLSFGFTEFGFYEPNNEITRTLKNRAYENMKAVVLFLHQNGIPIVPGSDYWGASALIRELETYVDSGLEPVDVLSMATIESAQVLELDATLGSIEPGKFADIILIDGDPTVKISDLRNIDLVIKNGEIYSPESILKILGMNP